MNNEVKKALLLTAVSVILSLVATAIVKMTFEKRNRKKD